MAAYRGATFGNQANQASIDYSDFVLLVWRARWKIVIGEILSVLVAIAYLHTTTPLYTTTLKVTPISSTAMAKGGTLQGIADLAGIGLSKDLMQTNLDLYIDGLQSRNAASVLMKNEELIKQIFYSEWSEETKSWRNPNPSRYEAMRFIRRMLGLPAPEWAPPSAARLETYLKNRMNVARSRETSIVSVSFRHRDPAFGQQFLATLHTEVDDELRQRALVRTAAYIDYLSQKLRTTTITEYRQALIDALSDQEKSRMMASARVSYAADPFGPPVSSRLPTSPNGALTFLVAVGLGVLAGIGVTAIRRR